MFSKYIDQDVTNFLGMCNEITENKQVDVIDLTTNGKDEHENRAQVTHSDFSTCCCPFRLVVRNEVSCFHIAVEEEILCTTSE